MSPSPEVEPSDAPGTQRGPSSVTDRIVRGLLYLTLLTPLVYVPGVYQSFVVPRAVFFRVAVGVAVLAAAWLVHRGRIRRLAPGRDPVLLALIGYLVVYGVTSWTSVAPLKSLFGETFRMWGGLAWLHLLAYYVLLRGWMRRRDWTRFLGGAVAVSGVVSALALARSAGLAALPGLPASDGGLAGNPGYLAIYLAICLGLAVPLWRRAGRWGRAGLTLVALVNLAGILLTGNRTSLIALLAGGGAALACAGVWITDRRLRRRIAAGSGVLVLAALLVVGAARAGWMKGIPAVSSLAETRWTGKPLTVRRLGWDAAVRGTLDRPFLGVGPENFGVVWQKQFRPAWYEATSEMEDEVGAPSEVYLQRPHNAFLRAFAETGLLGGLSFLGVFVAFFVAVNRARRRGGLGGWEAAGLAGLAAAYAVVLSLWFEEYGAFPLFLAAGAFTVEAGADPSSPDGPAGTSPWAGRTALAIVLTAAVASSVYYHGRLSAAAWWVGRAEASPNWSERVDRYERALSARPYGTQNMSSRFATTVQRSGEEFRQRREDETFLRIADRAIGRAILELGEDIARDPQNARLHANQGGVYFFGAYYVFEDERFFRRAVARLRRAIALAPAMLVYRHQLALVYLDAGRPERAIEVVEGALDRFDRWYRTHRLRARARLAAGDTVAAGRALHEMVRLRGEWGDVDRRAVRRIIVPAIERAGRPDLADSLRRIAR